MDSIVKLIDTIQQYISYMCVSFTTTFFSTVLIGIFEKKKINCVTYTTRHILI